MPLFARVRILAAPAFIAAAIFAAAACSNPVGEGKVPPKAPDQINYASSLNVTLSQFTRNPDGVYVQDQVPGTGSSIASGDSVSVGYTGWLSDGTKFDTNQPSGAALRFKIGAGSMIKGFESGVVGMRVGGTRRLLIPSELAYGREGKQTALAVIQPYSVLVFSITLIQRY